MPLGINLFGSAGSKPAQEVSAKDALRDWQRRLRSEARAIERGIRKIEQEEEKIKRDIKALADKGGDPKNIQLLAKSVVRSEKAKGRLYNARANMTAVATELQSTAATMRLADAMKTSTNVMQQINSLTKVPETMEAMATMQKEMMRAGLIEEMMDEGLEDIDGPEMEEEVQGEVDQVLESLAIDAAIRLAVTQPDGAAAASVASGLPASSRPAAAALVEGGPG